MGAIGTEIYYPIFECLCGMTAPLLKNSLVKSIVCAIIINLLRHPPAA